MSLPDYNSPSALKAFLDSKGMAMQKKFGQNFLINSNARNKLVDALDVKKDTTVWEIGPGLGAMTHLILEKGAKLTVFEIDKGFASVLKDFFGDYDTFSIVEGDVLKTWKKHFELTGVPDRLFGNLPYNIAATILADFITEGVRFDSVVITVQKEVASRICAKPGTEDYSSFSVLCQWAYNVEPLLDLAGGSFWPRPNVDSRAVRLTKKNNWPCCKDRNCFMKLLRALYVARRKTIKNNLTQFLSNASLADEILMKAGIDSMTRAEKLCLEELLKLSDIVLEYVNEETKK
ncbi:MAG: ribosomal RNA small subunit methyltransferase A [Spirochaetaceae bacterium]|nr:ribosomal RNA small subunit methyltransferase A [Spirochaetaceae bacterium]